MNSVHKHETALRIDGEMTIYQAAELKQLLLGAPQDAPILALDLSAVTEIDSAGLQLLALAKTTREAGGGRLRLSAQSETVAETLALLNLAHYFGDETGSSLKPSVGKHANES